MTGLRPKTAHYGPAWWVALATGMASPVAVQMVGVVYLAEFLLRP